MLSNVKGQVEDACAPIFAITELVDAQLAKIGLSVEALKNGEMPEVDVPDPRKVVLEQAEKLWELGIALKDEAVGKGEEIVAQIKSAVAAQVAVLLKILRNEIEKLKAKLEEMLDVNA